MSKKVIITGAAGFVGHHIVEHIIKYTDWEIITLDRLSKTTCNGFDRLRDIEVFDDERVTSYTHDLNQPIGDGLIKEIGQVDYILHVAAASHVDNSIEEPVPFIINNVKSTLEMLEFARKQNKLQKFLYFSTDEVYGTAPNNINYVEGDRYNSGNPYSASKAAAEQCCYAYSNTYKLPIIITNGMNILGERQHHEKYLPKIINYVLDGKTLPIHSNADKTQAGMRHYIHARNIADAIVFILDNTTEVLDNIDASKGKFHIVGEKEFDNLALAQLVASIIDKPLKYEMIDFHSARPGHDLRYAMSGKKLSDYGWNPPVSIEQSIKQIIKWSLLDENLRWLDRA